MALTGHEPEHRDITTAQFRQRRVIQIISATALAISATAFTEWLLGRLSNQPIYLGTLLVLFGLLVCVRLKRLALATTVLLFTLTAMLSLLMWRNAGVRDPAVLAYPGILVFASLLGGRRLFLALVLFMATMLALLVAGNVGGWHESSANPVGWHTLVDLLAILLVTSFSVWLMASDLHRAMTRLEAEKQRIEFLANHDPLTGLPNRLLVRDRLDHATAMAGRNRRHAALMAFDLDNFKNVNDSLGHIAGDSLLKEVGERVRLLLRAGDTVSRQGGDEFLVVLEDLPDADAAAAVAIKVLEVLSQPFMVQGVEVHSSCSLGIAMFPGDGQAFDDLLKRADIAMYRAKEEGRNGFRFFDAQMNANVVEHVQLIAGLRSALQRGEFLLHYQPQLDLASQRIVGVEALIRWRHPELGLVPPGRFIPVAEQSGLIVEIGAWVLQEACRQARQWADEGLASVVMSVNVSPMQFRRSDIERIVGNALDSTGLPARLLELEITESLLIQDSNTFSDMLHRLKGLGVRLAIDDFGTGYSNLGYLKRFEVDRLKIDQSFVRRLMESPQDEAIVRAIIQIASSLKLETTAEGIEDAATLERLVAMGCQQGQGFYWSQALPPAECLALIRRIGISAATPELAQPAA